MKLLLPFLIFFVGLSLSAQQLSLRVEPANVVKEVFVDKLDNNYQDVTSVFVTNRSNRTIQLVQRVQVKNAPGNWNYGIFNRSNQTAPYPMSQADLDEGRPVRLGAGETVTFVVVLEPGGTSGRGTVDVLFSDLGSPNKIISEASLTTKIVRQSSPSPNLSNSGAQPVVNRPTPTTVRLYPNPDRGKNFFVEAPPGTEIGRVEVANTLGNRLRKFTNDPGKAGYDIKDLPDGLYLVFIYDKNGKKLKTLRLLHRRFGA